MKFLRKILVKVLGLRGYLKFVSRTYIKMIRNGKRQDEYPELYFVKRIVQYGDTILDIGANLAYYSYFMAQNMGKDGKLLAVEPIPLFADVWKKNMSDHEGFDVNLYNCALGSEAQDKVKMSIPIVNGVVRHGLTKIDSLDEGMERMVSFDVPMRVGDELIESAGITQLNYVKCDVEGYEQYVIPSLDKTIDKYKPLFQIELGGEENRKNVVEYLVKKGYDLFILKGDMLKAIQKNDIFSLNQDFYFIHKDNLSNSEHLIRK